MLTYIAFVTASQGLLNAWLDMWDPKNFRNAVPALYWFQGL